MLLIPTYTIYLLLKELRLLNINSSIEFICTVYIDYYLLPLPSHKTPISLVITKDVYNYISTYLIDIYTLRVITQLNNLPFNTYNINFYLCESIILHLNNNSNSFELNFISSSFSGSIFSIMNVLIDNTITTKALLDYINT